MLSTKILKLEENYRQNLLLMIGLAEEIDRMNTIQSVLSEAETTEPELGKCGLSMSELEMITAASTMIQEEFGYICTSPEQLARVKVSVSEKLSHLYAVFHNLKQYFMSTVKALYSEKIFSDADLAFSRQLDEKIMIFDVEVEHLERIAARRAYYRRQLALPNPIVAPKALEENFLMDEDQQINAFLKQPDLDKAHRIVEFEVLKTAGSV